MRTPWISLIISCLSMVVGMKPLSERDENPQRDRFEINQASLCVGMKPLSERDENVHLSINAFIKCCNVGMKPLSERDENTRPSRSNVPLINFVGMKPLSERDENGYFGNLGSCLIDHCRNEATL